MRDEEYGALRAETNRCQEPARAHLSFRFAR